MTARLAQIRSTFDDGAGLDRAVTRMKAASFNGLFNHGAFDGLPAVLDWATAARRHAMKAWVTVVPGPRGEPVFAPDALPPVQPWLYAGEAALDPRRSAARARLDAVTPDVATAQAWADDLATAVVKGVTGFICREVDRCPVAFWTSTIAAIKERTPEARFVAWTSGLPASTIDALIDAGFDGVCASLAWWDGRSRWLLDELRRHPHAERVMFPADPFAVATDRAPSTSDLARHRAQLWIAAALTDIVLVPAAWTADENMSALLEASGAINRGVASPLGKGDDHVEMLSGPDAPVTAIVKADAPDLRIADRIRLTLFNADADTSDCSAAQLTARLGGFGRYRLIGGTGGTEGASTFDLDPRSTIRLARDEVLVLEGERIEPVTLPLQKKSALAALDWPRVAIEEITPTVDNGRFPVKRTAGEAVRVEADLIIDGHEKLAAALLYRPVGEKSWREVDMVLVENDRYAASFPLLAVGRHEFTIEAWRDVFANYRYEIDKKFAAGLDVSLELAEGRLLVDEALKRARDGKRNGLTKRLAALAKDLEAPGSGETVPKLDAPTRAAQVAALLASQTLADMRAADARPFATRPPQTFLVDAERTEASFASWYELFPRSAGNTLGQPLHHGTFDDVIDRIPAVREMGFDVLYFTPIHPIGRKNRKGRNNSLTALEGDPGSPYAIGAAEGGHDALHPELGSFEDFKRMREAAIANGLELALDFAIQCSPDHPWLKSHPDWFAWRPDGSLRYAENPPKKYEDIVNVDFWPDRASRDETALLWTSLRDVILLWVDAGVKIFRVDNPHTKALPFWDWMIGEVRARHPDTIFLSEAFTRPKVMYQLAKVGFSQSYTYFTWRHTKQEFIDYLTELTTTRPGQSSPKDFFRPNFFVNTPDINPYFLQRSGRAGFLIRAALASTLAGVWGVYSGFELCEAMPVPGKEEYLDSEKYEIRAWDWKRPGNIIAEVTALNRIRRENPALQTHLNVQFEVAHDPNILYFLKTTEDASNVLLVAINLDPHGVHEADFEVPLWRWGKPDDATVEVVDCLDGRRFHWQGKHQRMRLDPAHNPYAIWRVVV